MSPEAQGIKMAEPAERVPSEDAPGLPAGAGWAVAGLTSAAFIAFIAFVVVYAHWGTPLVQRMDSEIGEVLLERGTRFEEAGEYESAVHCFKQALGGRFDGATSRTYTLKRLGALLCWREGAEAGLHYLQEAYKNTDCPISTYTPLCGALLELGKAEQALEVAARWLREAKASDHAGHQAKAKYYQGKAYQAQGDPAKALTSFLEGNALDPGGTNAYEAGLIYYRAGERDKALELLGLFLEKGGAGERAQYVRSLCERLKAEQAKPGVQHKGP